jgi:two-component system sensor kinase FixL
MQPADMELLLNTLPGMAYRCGVEAPWALEFVSAGVSSICSHSPEDFTSGKVTWGDIVHAADMPAVEREVSTAVEEGRLFTMTYRLVDPVLGERWMHERGQAIRDDSGSPVALVGFITDITEQKRVEERLQHSGAAHEAQLRTIVETVPVGIVMAELPSGRIVDGNSFVEQLVRHPVLYSPDVHSYDEWVSYHADGTRVKGEEYPLARMVLAGEENPSIDVNYRRGDGTFAWTRIMGRPVRDAGGTVVGGVVALVDIDEERKSWDRVAEQVQSLQSQLIHTARVSAMGAMASALAHELNQPLTAIVNYMRGTVRLIEQGGEGAEAAVHSAALEAEASALRAGEIIRRLRGMLVHGDLKVQGANVAKLLEEASALALIGTKEEGIVYSQDVEPGLNVQVDPVQIQQVLINILRNAVDAVATSSKRQIHAKALVEGDHVLLSISDTGCGLSSEARRTLFEPFVSTKSTGMGVGLSICRTILEAHGGKIWALDREGGATFCITLPMRPQPV